MNQIGKLDGTILGRTYPAQYHISHENHPQGNHPLSRSMLINETFVMFGNLTCFNKLSSLFWNGISIIGQAININLDVKNSSNLCLTSLRHVSRAVQCRALHTGSWEVLCRSAPCAYDNYGCRLQCKAQKDHSMQIRCARCTQMAHLNELSGDDCMTTVRCMPYLTPSFLWQFSREVLGFQKKTNFGP